MRRIVVLHQRVCIARVVMLLSLPLSPLLLNAQSAPVRSSSPQVGAPTVLTLPEAQARARQVSLALTALRAEVAAATALERQSRAISNPAFSYQREQTSGSGQENSQSIASVDQPLDFATRNARVAGATRRREAAEARLRDGEARVELDATRAYALAIAASRRAVLADQAAQIFARAREVSNERLRAGDVSGYADRRIRLEAARYAALSAEATLAEREARLLLSALISPDGTVIAAIGFELQSPTVVPTPLTSTDSLLALALTQRADLRAARLESEAAVADARQAARSRVPVPVLTAGVKSERIEGVGDLNGFVAGIALPLPLWDRRRGAVDAAEADAARAAAQSGLLQRNIATEVQQAVAAVAAIDDQLRILTPELGEVAAAALRSAEVAYAEGELSLIEWLDAVRAYQEAESAFASLQAERLIRHAALRRAVGSSSLGQLP